MLASPLDSVDILKNVYFDYIFPLNNLSRDSDDFLSFDCIFHLKDLSGDSDDCLRGFCNFHMHHYIYVFIYILIFVPIRVMVRSFILMSTVRPDIALSIVRVISISIFILASS